MSLFIRETVRWIRVARVYHNTTVLSATAKTLPLSRGAREKKTRWYKKINKSETEKKNVATHEEKGEG